MTCFRFENGETLFSYCKRNKYPYTSIWRYLDKGLSLDKAVELYEKTKGRKDLSAKYFYKGKKLTEIVAYDKNMYSKIIMSIRKKHFNLNEAVERILK